MSLQDALLGLKLDRMLKQQQERLRQLEAQDKPTSDVVKAIQRSQEEVDFALQNGGLCYVEIEVEGKKKKFKVAVHTKEADELVLPKFKFHVKSALGHTVYIQAKDRTTAQSVVNKLFGRGLYTVSAAFI